ncbi:MAG: DNA mismatch repair protein [Myxococcales bacterium]|nr:DNA mismatch repair protein [Myxococcales bacterium]
MRSRRGSTAVSSYMRATAGLVAGDEPTPAGGGSRTPLDGPFAMSRMQEPVPVPEGAAAAAPDLLHPEPCVCLDQRTLTRALEFAFAAGDAAGCAGQALDRAAICPSIFRPDAFASDIFLDELIDQCLHFSVEGRRAPLARGHLRRLLGSPPSDPRVTAFRHEVLAELEEHPAMRKGLEGAYAHVAELMRLFDESGGHSRLDLPRWRLDLLGCLRRLFDALHGPFAGASSGLARLHIFAEHVHASQGYQDLCALLDFEGDMAHVDLHLRLGIDGRIRQLDVRKILETRSEPFYRSPLVRFLLRVSMWLRGYRVGEAELVERWFDHVYGGVSPFLPAILQLRGDMEFYLAAQQLRERAEARGLSVCLPELVDSPEGTRAIGGLFNPLLLSQSGPPVPCTLDVDSFQRMCILTGPNSGGKTRLLQAIGLTQMLGQAGFYVPAEHAVLRRASGMFVSLGQETSADQTEGRLGTELMRIRQLFEQAHPHSLVVLDELCSGTNPSEGEEIFHLVVELLRELRPEVFITTHFLKFAGELAERADELSLCFLQVELDEHEKPTYQFIPGVATTSLAHRTAARLGVTRDELLELVRRNS